MATTVSLNLNDASEAVAQWAADKYNKVHAQDADFVAVDLAGWVRAKAAEVINAERLNKFNEEFEASRAAEMKKQGLA
jgi:hypothetical protein